jgi:DNA-binding ferritin-like protein
MARRRTEEVTTNRRLGDVSERIRARMDRLGELDAASQDVLVEVVRALEQQLWMIRAQFRQEGGRAT